MFSIEPVGYVRNNRRETVDDFWGDVESEILISEKMSEECTKGLEKFSHIEVIFYFHLVDISKINIAASHPRGNSKFPKAGIFAQRKKARPNLLGSTIAKLLSVDGRSLTVTGLDAVDGTPVIDIKPVIREFLPQSAKVIQPDWASELMRDYWSLKKS